jgi:hypothetical protein
MSRACCQAAARNPFAQLSGYPRRATLSWFPTVWPHNYLLQTEAFGHQTLEARFVENVVGEFFVGEHRERGALGTCGKFGGFFYGKAGVLADDGADHAHHDLQASDAASFVLRFGVLGFGDLAGRQMCVLMVIR